MPPTSLPWHRGGNVSLSHGSGNLHLSGQEEELYGTAHHAVERTGQDFKRGLKSFNENANILKLICHNATICILQLKRRHSKVPTVFPPKQTRPNTTAKYQSPQPSPFSDHFLWGPFCFCIHCVTGRVTPQPSFVLVTPWPEPQRTQKTTAALRPGRPEPEPGDAAAPTPTPSRATNTAAVTTVTHIFFILGQPWCPAWCPAWPMAQLL
jgi:hypothetical protein